MPLRLLPATLILLAAGTLISAMPPDLPVHTSVTRTAAQEPEMPIDGLLVEAAEDQNCPARTLTDLVIDFVCPPLRLRHLPMVMECPCCKACCASLEETLAHCCEAVHHSVTRAACHEDEHPRTCPYCPAGGRCHGDSEESTEDAATPKEPDENAETPPEPEVLAVMPEDPSCRKPVNFINNFQGHDHIIGLQPAAEPAQPCTPSCPYLRGHASAPEMVQPTCPTTPLDNFDRLMKAWRIYRKAEHCRADGHIERACRLYERARKLCPGSRIEHLACVRLEQLYAQKAVQDVEPAAEEAEPIGLPHEANANYDRLQTECMTIADELRDKASQLLEQGHYVEAAALADMAYRFSTDCENVFNLLAKAHAILTAPKQEEQPEEKPAQPGCATGQAPDCNAAPSEEPSDESQPDAKTDPLDGEDTEVMPPAEEPAEMPEVPPGGSDALVQPPLPPVDPAVVDALEKVLREVGDPTIPKLVIEADSPSAEEQQDPVSTWPYTPPQTDVPPSLLVEPDEDDLVLEPDDAPAVSSPEDEAWDYVGEHLEGMLLGATNALRQHLCCDVDLAGPAAPRGRINFQIGAVQCTVVSDTWGHRLVIVSLAPEATGDLREVQQAHNERVIHWIEVMNSGGNSSDDDTTATDDDDDDSDLLYYDEPYPL